MTASVPHRSSHKHAPCPDLNPYFSGRSSQLRHLANALDKHSSVALTAPSGTGKTQLVLACAKNLQNDGLVPGGVYWLSVDGDAYAIVLAIANLLEQSFGCQIAEPSPDNATYVLHELRRCLHATNGRWLLCLDNVFVNEHPKPDGFLGSVCALPNETSNNGWVVVTTRQEKRLLWHGMSESQKLSLSPLSHEDSLCCLWRISRAVTYSQANDASVLSDLRVSKDSSNSPEVHAMMELLEGDSSSAICGQPLPLVLAASYVRRFESSFTKFLNLYNEVSWKAEFDEMLAKSDENESTQVQERALGSVWGIVVRFLAPAVRKLLRIISFFGDVSIPKSLLELALTHALEIDVQDDSLDERFQDIVSHELVEKLHLLQMSGVGNHIVFRVHPRLCDTIRAEIGIDSQDFLTPFNSALLSIHLHTKQLLASDGCSFNNLPTSCSYHLFDALQHSVSVLRRMIPSNYSQSEQVRPMYQLQDLHQFAGWALSYSERGKEAVEIWEGLVHLLRNHYGEDVKNESILSAMYNLGSSYQVVGRLSEATTMLTDSIEIGYQVFGQSSSHPAISKALSCLGTVYHEQGSLEEAATVFGASMDMDREIYGADAVHPSIATTLNHLGSLYRELEMYQEAVSTFAECLQMKLLIHGHGNNHPSIASTLNNLGIAFRENGKLHEASLMLNKCLDMNRAIYGNEAIHSTVADVQGHLGVIYEEQGKLDEAAATLRDSLTTLRAIHGQNSNHLSIASALNNLGIVYRQHQKFPEAATVLSECLAMKRAIYGHNAQHPSIALTLNNLGDVYEKQGKLEEAACLLSECLMMERVIHQSTIASASHVANKMG